MTTEMGGGKAAIHVFDLALRHLRVLFAPELVAADGLALDGNRHHPHPNPSPSPSPNHVLLPHPWHRTSILPLAPPCSPRASHHARLFVSDSANDEVVVLSTAGEHLPY